MFVHDDAGRAGIGEPKRRGFLDHMVDVLERPLGLARFGHLPEALEDRARAVRLVVRLFHGLVYSLGVIFIRRLQPPPDDLKIGRDRRQWLVELVRHRGRELAKRTAADAVDQLGLQVAQADVLAVVLAQAGDHPPERIGRFVDLAIDAPRRRLDVEVAGANGVRLAAQLRNGRAIVRQIRILTTQASSVTATAI